MDEMNDEND